MKYMPENRKSMAKRKVDGKPTPTGHGRGQAEGGVTETTGSKRHLFLEPDSDEFSDSQIIFDQFGGHFLKGKGWGARVERRNGEIGGWGESGEGGG
jgi:hypothetical protein